MRFAFDLIGLIRDQVRGADAKSEAGGLLFGREDLVLGAFATNNVAFDPRAEFAIDPQVMDHLLRTEESRGHELIGSYHSHPGGNAQMSNADAAMARSTGLLLIVGTGRFWDWRLWDPLAGGEVEFAIAPPYQVALGLGHPLAEAVRRE